MSQAKIDAINARIAKLTAERDELVEALANDVTTKVIVGDTITFNYGRAEKRRTLNGVIVGRKSQEKGADLIRVQVGTGFDIELVTIYPTDVLSIVPVVVIDEPTGE